MSLSISQDDKTALVFGATGLVGGHLVNFLLLHPAYEKVRIFSRRPLEVEHPKLEEQIIDFDRLEESAPLMKGEDVFVCLGTTRAKAGSREAFRRVDYEYPLQIAQFAADQGANQFLLVSSAGADPESLFYYLRVKGELERDLRKLNFWALQLFRPSLLLGEREDHRLAEKAIGKFSKLLGDRLLNRLGPYRPVPAELVARAMVRAAQQLEPGVHLYHSDELADLAGRGRLPRRS